MEVAVTVSLTKMVEIFEYDTTKSIEDAIEKELELLIGEDNYTVNDIVVDFDETIDYNK